MSYRRFTEKTTIDVAREEVDYTLAALNAYPDNTVRAFAKPLEKENPKLDESELAVRNAKRKITASNAVIRMRDALLDRSFKEFGKDLLAEARQDRGSKLFRAIMGSNNVSDVVDLSLEPEITEVSGVVEALQSDVTPAALRKKWVPLLKSDIDEGNAALNLRRAAMRDSAEAYASQRELIERIDRVRRAIDGKLTQYAAELGLEHDFSDQFFIQRSSRPAKRKTGSTPTPVPSPT